MTRGWLPRARRAGVSCMLVAGLVGSLFAGRLPARAALTGQQRDVLASYLKSLQHADYVGAYAVLTASDRRYFGSATNYASIYAADRFKLDTFRILGSTKASDGRNAIAFVSEHVSFFDHAHQVGGSALVRVSYAIVSGARGPGISDPTHPWRAVAPVGASAMKNGLRVTIRKISFFPGRIEIVATFQNLGDKTVTVLPFLRSTVRDETGTPQAPIATRSPDLTDKTLYTGLALPGSGQYTGAINFRTAERYAPKRLSIVFAPALADGGDAPFEVSLPSIAIPSAT